MCAGGALGGLMALLVGWPCFRLSGHYYAIATVVVGEIGYLLVLNWDWVGGATGINIPYVRSHRRFLAVAAVPDRQAAVPLRGAGVCLGGLAGGLADRGVSLGVRLAGGERRSGSGTKSGGADLSVEDGGGGDQRRADRYRRGDLCAVRRLHRSGQRAVWAVVHTDPVAGGAGRRRHAVGAAGGRGGADPACPS